MQYKSSTTHNNFSCHFNHLSTFFPCSFLLFLCSAHWFQSLEALTEARNYHFRWKIYGKLRCSDGEGSTLGEKPLSKWLSHDSTLRRDRLRIILSFVCSIWKQCHCLTRDNSQQQSKDQTTVQTNRKRFDWMAPKICTRRRRTKLSESEELDIFVCTETFSFECNLFTHREKEGRRQERNAKIHFSSFHTLRRSLLDFNVVCSRLGVVWYRFRSNNLCAN